MKQYAVQPYRSAFCEGKRYKRRLCFFVAALFTASVFLLAVQPAHAASAKANIKKTVKQMDNFEYYLFAAKGSFAKNTKIKLTAKTKAKAAALSVKTKASDQTYDGIPQEYVAYWLSKKKIRKAGQDLFGKPVSVSNLPKKMEDGLVGVCVKSGKLIVYYLDRETDMDLASKKLAIKKCGSGKYTAKHDVYFGWWNASGGKANYRITYGLKKNKVSKYGYVITFMSIKPL